MFVPQHNTIKHKQVDNYKRARGNITVYLSVHGRIPQIVPVHGVQHITQLMKVNETQGRGQRQKTSVTVSFPRVGLSDV